MQITVKCFAGCKDAVGASLLTLNTPDDTTVGAVLEQLIRQYPGMASYRQSLMLAVNKEYAGHDQVLRDGDELACIPPVSGGIQSSFTAPHNPNV